MKFFQSVCLATSLLLASPTNAAPIAHKRQNTGAKKRIALWEWTLTRDVPSYPAIQSTATSLGTSTEIAAVMNWEGWQPTEVPVAFEPMARVLDSFGGDAWTQLTGSLATQQQAGVASPPVHFLNEPERQGVSAADAANTWRGSFAPLRAQYGAKLVGPAPASDPAGSAWLQEFMSYLGADEKPDYLGVHFYTAQSTASSDEVAAAQAYIRGQYDAYGIPVVVSEIASTNRDAGEVDSFTRQMAQWLDAQDWVFQYGFFGMSREVTNDFVSPAAQLLDFNGNLTPLGLFYAGFE
ncbi:hypothetical protein MGN70_003333 [Eutypa lata]|uniref:Putative glycosyl hydrolase 53 domain-containing protein n=1 Tax=Eutypa lata (strain UCR-EL1) TaxID=1287681 RepID=M7SH53_EUTLA|nr:putative glycosyl hydrolase 53 domain-containing protein [Eutypa lata UCREL1]KAI1255268.1 hypothetical protein MGN70_003333 [Eutypa lata]